ncbi:MAG: glycosyltransferase family 2 protein [Saprospiraceae bacterium]|jgi:glycosyltransferase involved in cell wall biosynthesis|nr:glycosyltransferase family 2 protein [Saprospiraceae bacterium]
MHISIVIPCYNVSQHIEEVISKIPANIAWIITVNDASKDNSKEILLNLSKSNKRIIFIDHALNQGVGGAMLTGYAKALELKSEIIIKIDGDGQMDADNIPKLIRPLIDNIAEFTKGNRFRDFKALRSMPITRRIGNLGLSFIIKAASGYWNIFDPTNGFTAIKSETLAGLDFSKIHKRYYFETSMLIELYYNNAVIVDVPFKAIYGDEISGLSRFKTMVEFPPKLFIAFLKRIILKYFLFDFNIASIYFLCGTPMFIYGLVFGLINYFKYTAEHEYAPTGTILIPTLFIILGFQLLLSAISYDISNYPKRSNS